MRLREALHYTAELVSPVILPRGKDEASLEAEVLLMHLLGVGRTQLYCQLEEELSPALAQPLEELVRRRRRGEPLAYLVGHREFYGLDFVVNKEVLIPRPETEILVAEALEWAQARCPEASTVRSAEPPVEGYQRAKRPSFDELRTATNTGATLSLSKGELAEAQPLTVADVGTGCGNIAIALAFHLPQARFYAIDVSPAALEVARENALRHQVADRVTFLQGDLLLPLPEPVDLVVANLPYVRDDELLPLLAEVRPGVFVGEPELALRGGPDGLALLRRFLAQAPAYLRSGGAIFLEVAYDQGEAVAALAEEHFPGAAVGLTRDWGGWNRVVSIRLSTSGSTGSPQRSGHGV